MRYKGVAAGYTATSELIYDGTTYLIDKVRDWAKNNEILPG